jgi:hypothetical protein
MNTGTAGAGASLWQDIPISTTGGQSFSFTAWIRAPAGGPVTACLVLWGLGGTQEGGGSQQTCDTNIRSTWKLLTAPLDTASAHTTLRAQIIMYSAGPNYDVDGAQVADAGLKHASFENGDRTGWALSPNASWATYSGARDGQTFLEMNTGTAGGGASLWQDIPISTTPGQSFTFTVWMRAPAGGPINACLVLWGLGGTQEGGASQQTCDANIRGTWKLLTAPLDTTTAHTTLRAQIYMYSAGPNYDVDGAQVN